MLNGVINVRVFIFDYLFLYSLARRWWFCFGREPVLKVSRIMGKAFGFREQSDVYCGLLESGRRQRSVMCNDCSCVAVVRARYPAMHSVESAQATFL